MAQKKSAEPVEKTDEDERISEVDDEKKNKPSWVKMKPAEIEEIITELGQKGESPSKIGMILRDKYGVPKTKAFGKRISQILDDKKIKYKTDKDMVQQNIDKLKTHAEKNKHDYTASRALTKKLWALQKFN